ncbi:MAG: hypothetical protein M0Q91_06265 [Methanoregula sp.]|jgi:hypothetical protein|nr:hypothetical protein [Methanoregula sp.]
MKTFSGYPCIGIAVVMLVAVSVLFTGCTTNPGQSTPAPVSTSAPVSTPAPVSTSAPVSTNVSASLPYGVKISVPADWTRQDVLTSDVRDYGTTTVNIANFYSPYAIPNDHSSYISLSIDIDQNPGSDFEKYFNNATLAVEKTYDVLTHVEVRSYTLTISGYKSYELDFQTRQVKGTYIFTSTENGMYIFAFKVPNKPPAVQVFQGEIVDIYKSIRINPPIVDVTPYR